MARTSVGLERRDQDLHWGLSRTPLGKSSTHFLPPAFSEGFGHGVRDSCSGKGTRLRVRRLQRSSIYRVSRLPVGGPKTRRALGLCGAHPGHIHTVKQKRGIALGHRGQIRPGVYRPLNSPWPDWGGAPVSCSAHHTKRIETRAA
jgi:hypothetical protein